MLNLKHFYLPVVLILLLSCKQNSEFPKQVDLNRYLIEVHHFNPDTIQNSYELILQMYMCGACTENTMKLIQQIQSEHTCYFVLSANNQQSEAALEKKKNSHIIVGDGNVFEHYGLRQSRDVLIHIEKGKIIYWDYITTSTIPDMILKIK